MSQIVVDTDVASYIFNWHSSAQRHVDALRGSELILSFVSIAEMRMGALAARWGVRRRALIEQFMEVSLSFMPTTRSVLRGRCFEPAPGRQAGH
jgi:predicted nucleic acid-binding protein